MAEGKFISYLRVSTAKQGASGLGVEAQRAAVESFLNGGSWKLLAEFVEVESGKNNERPELAKALHRCRLAGATLVIAKLDRLSRNAHFLLGLQEAGVAFVAADMPTANELTIGIMACVAQAERKAISARTEAALKAYKERAKTDKSLKPLGGWKGGPKVNPALGREAVVEAADAYARDVGPTIQALRAEGMSLRQIAARLTADGTRTARGGAWTATAVANVLARLP